MQNLGAGRRKRLCLFSKRLAFLLGWMVYAVCTLHANQLPRIQTRIQPLKRIPRSPILFPDIPHALEHCPEAPWVGLACPLWGSGLKCALSTSPAGRCDEALLPPVLRLCVTATAGALHAELLLKAVIDNSVLVFWSLSRLRSVELV